MNQGMMTLITVAIVLGVAALVLWMLYTVTWRAVRRGLHEHDRMVLRATAGSSRVLPQVTRDVVPDYPPREWV
ncbi:MAG: hypothetical protein ABIP33_09360 [Pseudolysinimonas sp.]